MTMEQQTINITDKLAEKYLTERKLLLAVLENKNGDFTLDQVSLAKMIIKITDTNLGEC